MTFDDETIERVEAMKYHADRYSGKDSIDKMMGFICWSVIVAVFVAIAVFNFNEHRMLGLIAAIFFSWIPALYLYEYRQLKKKELTGQKPRTLF